MSSDCPPPAGAGARRARSCCWHEVTRTRRPPWSTRPSHMRRTVGRKPWDTEVLTELELAAMLDDQPGALETARSYLAQLDDCDSPLTSAGAARIGFQALCLARSTPGARTDELRDRAARQLALAQGGLTDEWRPTYYGVQLALAEAYAARYAGEPAVDQFRTATDAGRAVRRLLRPRAAPEPGHRAARPRRPGRGPRAPRRVLEHRPRHGCTRPRAPRLPARHPHPRSSAPVRHHARDR